MRNDLRTLRRDIDDAAARIEPPALGGFTSAPTIIGPVVNGGSIPKSVPGIFKITPSTISGTQAEGSPFTLTPIDPSLTELVTVLGPGVPAVGDILIARGEPGGRWIANVGTKKPSCTIVALAYNCLGDPVSGARATLISDESQAIEATGQPTGGTFTLTFQGQTTTPLPFNATPSAIQAALVALSSIGAGNVGARSTMAGIESAPTILDGPIVITFVGDLAKQAQPPITANDNALVGGQIDVFDVLTGGITYSGIIPESGIDFGSLDKFIESITTIDDYYVFMNLQSGTWELTITAENYLDFNQTIGLNCPGIVRAGGQLTVADGFMITKGNSEPVEPPGSASLSGDPNGMGSLSLGACTGGTAIYVGTPGPQTFEIPGTSGEWTRQYWIVASFGCATGLSVLWTFSFSQGIIPVCSDGFIGQVGAPGCLPGGTPGDFGCAFCNCTSGWWGISPQPGPQSLACGPNPWPLLKSAAPGAGAGIGGGCFEYSSAVPTVVQESVFVPGWVGESVAYQAATIWGTPTENSGLLLDTVPCISATLD